MHPRQWWLDSDERTVRNEVSVIRLRSHLMRLRSQEVARHSRELGASSSRSLAKMRSLVRRSNWLMVTGHRLPRLIQGGRRGP